MNMMSKISTELKVRNIPLSMLIPAPENVRRFMSEAGLQELAASILSQGLLQNLTVRKNAQGKYEVKAGGRRLRALKELAKKNQISKGYVVACHELKTQNDVEVSLAENMVREAMHPADEIEAFFVLHDGGKGMTAEMIGDRFGISHMSVRRRLKLANVSPKIIQLFRDDKVTLEQLQVLAITDDHAKQEAAFLDVETWQRQPHQLRNVLTSELVKANDPLAKFVGLAAYKKAGGDVVADLFDGDKGGSYSDRGLLLTLATQKLEAALKDCRGQGWAWISASVSFERHSAMILRPLPQALKPALAKRRAILLVKLDLLEEGEALLTDKQKLQVQNITSEIDQIDGDALAYSLEQKAVSGVVAYVGYDGKLAIEQGVVKTEDRKAASQIGKTPTIKEDLTVQSEIKGKTEVLSGAVIEDLSKHQTVALSAHIASQPDFAFRLMVFNLARHYYCSGATQGVLEIFVRHVSVTQSQQDSENMLAYEEAHKRRQAIEALVPKDQNRLWVWAMEATDERLKEVLAQLVANGLNVTRPQGKPMSQLCNTDLSRIVKQTQFNFRAWWQPSSSFFKRVSKAVAVAAVTECGLSEQLAASLVKAPRANGVQVTAEALKPTIWIPSCVRPIEVLPEVETVGVDDDSCPFDTDDAVELQKAA